MYFLTKFSLVYQLQDGISKNWKISQNNDPMSVPNQVYTQVEENWWS